MKDNDQIVNFGVLIDVGVCFFKIEGCYKDMSYVKNIIVYYCQMFDVIIEECGDLVCVLLGCIEYFFVLLMEKIFYCGSIDYFVNVCKGDIGVFDLLKFIGLLVGEVVKVVKDYFDVVVIELLVNGDGLNVLIKCEVVGFCVNMVEKIGENQYCVWFNEMLVDLYKICLYYLLNCNFDYNWQQVLIKIFSECWVVVDIELGGWQE